MSAVPASEPLRFLVGPTATGKSELALELARRVGAEIVSLDSMLVYRGMDIGTAKPGAAARALVRHHALDLVGPDETFTLTQYLAVAEEALRDIAARGGRALFVGGTALYLKSLIHGLFDGPEVDPQLRSELELRYEREGPVALHAELASVDARSAARIHRNDKKRVVRALEVWRQSGRTLSDWQNEWGWHEREARARTHVIAGVSSEVELLDARIAARTRTMLDAGWPDEARRIHDTTGFSSTAVQALGYADALALALDQIDRPETERRIALATRQFARRQRTWFRKFTQSTWFDAATAPDQIDALSRALWPT